MIEKIRAFFARQTTIRSIIFTFGAVSLAAVLIMAVVASVFVLMGPQVITPPDLIRAGVDISESVDNQSSNITATVRWTTPGTSDSITVVAVKDKSTVDDKSILQKVSESVAQPFAEDEAPPQGTLNEIGQSVSFPDLSSGDKLKIIATDGEESRVLGVHTVG